MGSYGPYCVGCLVGDEARLGIVGRSFSESRARCEAYESPLMRHTAADSGWQRLHGLAIGTGDKFRRRNARNAGEV